ncbi:DinB family protein [Smaragdicoccus niigatensis]|uniref:DinB family protein n=1 Tax=Smaragdicoccus niigatensis TaxID=359359 RepID=UPI00036AB390
MPMGGGNPAKDALHRYLKAGRDALLWKLDGLSEYDVRRPMTTTGTNLLGLVKHLTGCEYGYFSVTFGREPGPLPSWLTEGGEPNVDMWATAEERREDIISAYRGACVISDANIVKFSLTHRGTVPGWPAERANVTLQEVLVHMIAETHRHAGHADIVRELIDGAAGMSAGDDLRATATPEWWSAHRDQVEEAARAAVDR